MLRIKYKSKPDFPGFEYACKRKDVQEQIAHHMKLWRFEMVPEKAGDAVVSVRREVKASDITAEWVEGDKVEQIPVPEYQGPAPKN